jgi:hypothetical protein
VPAFYEKFTDGKPIESTGVRVGSAFFWISESSFDLQIPTGKHWAASILWEIHFCYKVFAHTIWQDELFWRIHYAPAEEPSA